MRTGHLALGKGEDEGEGLLALWRMRGSNPSPQSSPLLAGERRRKPHAFGVWRQPYTRPLHILVCYISVNGKHRSNPASQTEIQRHEPDRLVVHRIIGLRSNRGQRRAAAEESVRRKA